MVKLYSIDCPKCIVLEKKLDKANISYDLCKDRNEMDSKGMSLMPVLEVDGIKMNYKEAIKWVNNTKIGG